MSVRFFQIVDPSAESAPTRSLPVDAGKPITQGDAAFEASDYRLAIDLYTRAIELDPNDAVAYSHRSSAYARTHCFREALQDGEKAIELNGTWPEAYLRKAVALHAMRRFDEAISVYTTGLNHGHSQDILIGLKEAKNDKELFEHAEADYEKGCEAFRSEKCDEAEEPFRRAWRVWPWDVKYLLSLADVYLQKGKWDQCILSSRNVVYEGYFKLSVEQNIIGQGLGRAGRAYLNKRYFLTASLLLKESIRKNPDPVVEAAIHSLGDVPLVDPDPDLRPSDIQGLPTHLMDIGHSLLNLGMLYTQWNPIENIHKAIQVKRDAVSLTRPGHPDMAARLNTLFNSLFRRYELYGQACDIEEAVTIQEEANRCTPDDSMHKAGCLYGLGNVYRIRFRHLGQLSDIDKAVEIHERSVNMTPDTDTDNKVIRLVSLSDSLECRFDGLGSLRDIDRTISMTTLAAQITANGHVHRDRVLGALGGAFRKRFDHLRELDDIDKAISFLEQAANLASADDEDKPVRLDHLANAYQARFQRFKAPSDIDKAVTHHNDAVQLTSNSHPRKPTVLSNLGNSLVARFEHSSEKPDIDRATQAHRDALALMPEGHAARPSCLNNLSVALVRRFLKYDDIQDINEAIEALNESVRLTPPGHPERASHLLNLGHAVRLLFTKSGDVKDIRRASSVFSEAARSESGPPSTLFEAAIQWSKYAQEAGTSPLEAFRCAVDLLSRVAWMGMSVFDRYVELYELGGIVREAAGAAIASGEYGTAVEWLEQGRSIVWGQQLQLRAPVHELRDTYPELATELVQVSKALEAANGRDTVYDEDAPQKRHNLVLEWEALVEKVRKETELKDFLRPLKYTELSKAASDSGPVIIVNVCGSRCDALIVLSNGSEPLHVPLPEFSLDQATSLERSFHKVLVGSGVGATRGINSAWSDNPDFRFRNLLSSLWSWVVKPIIEDLQTTMPRGKRGLRRVWWCPTGVLSLLPLHAAGIYDSKSPGNNVSDFVVSSYTPTLSALINARRHRGNPSSPLKLLIVAHPGTPSAPIPNTEAELKYITKRCGRSIKRCGGKIHYTTLTGASASVPLVTQGMEQCGWIHLACHGVQNFQDPGKSALILTAPSDSTSNRLELSDIIRNPHPHATFAFLSACQTATGDSGLPDEVVHLASGMLVAGYGSVIATMWSIEDSDAPLVADSVYGDLFGKRHPDSTQAAFALHRAIKKLRDGGAPFLSWVPFIHLGD